jgi:FixJ family two-component response regulator
MRASYCNLALVDDDHAVRKSLAFLLALTGSQVVDYASADEFLQRGDLTA